MSATQTKKTNKKKRVFWQGHIEACETEGQTQVAYCREHGLAVATFQYHKRRLREERERPNQLRLVPLDGSTVDALSNGTRPQSKRSPSIKVRHGRFSVEVPPGVDEPTLRNVLTVLGRL